MARVPTETRSDLIRTDITGCIEDRPTEQLLYQAPGADLFFTAYKDLEKSVNGEPIEDRLVDSVTTDVENQEIYAVHNDSSHGEHYDGCGFSAKQRDIYRYTGENIMTLIARINESKEGSITEDLLQDIIALAEAAYRLAESNRYFEVTGGALTEAVVEAGAELITYDGDHTARELTIDETNGQTYDPVEANNDDDETKTSFNVDTDTIFVEKAKRFGIQDPQTARAFVKILSLATVDVLSGGEAPVHHR